MPYDVIRRPRLFRYAALRHSQDPAYEDRGELPNGGDPEDLEHQNQSYESRLWCLEFDIDKQGEKKTVRVIFGWPQYCPSFEDIERPGVDFPHGVKTFLGHTLYPISMRMDDADPSTCQMTAGGGWDFSTVREIRFVLYEDDPFGQLAEDRAEAASASGGMRVRGRNTVYVLANREEIYNKWKQFKRNGGTRLKAFFDEQRDLCARLNFDTLSALQKAVDSERKRREAAR